MASKVEVSRDLDAPSVEGGDAAPRSISLWLLRGIATLWLVQLLVQIGFAGAFVTGGVQMYLLHEENGNWSPLLPLIALVVAIVHVAAARGRRWIWVAALTVTCACLGQAALGWTRLVAAHIVGGSVLFALAAVWCLVLWRHRYAPRPRSGGGAVAERGGDDA